jgi:hypothetical protein
MSDFSKDNLPADEEFREYRKTTTTRMAGPYNPPFVVQTREGQYLTAEEPSFLALDADGFPYPVALSVVEKTYEEIS